MRPAELTRWLVDRVCERAELQHDEVDIDLPLSGLGIGSVVAAELAAELTALLGTDVHPALLFEHPTIRALADALGGAVIAEQSVRDQPSGGGAMAIVGMSVRVPGADSAGELWRLLREGLDPVALVPADRWRLEPGSLTEAERGAAFAGLLNDIESFDAAFFRIPREEAIRMDPQQRLLLQGGWEALEDGGQAPADLAGSRTGVYVGISNNDYVRRQLGSPDEIHALTPTGNALSVAANRLSYTLDLRGPSLAVDTACSSSLVAVHLALRDLRAGRCDLAIVGGVNVLIEPDASIALARAGMLAPDGRCKPFDAAANGYVRGEGCVVVVLKPLDRARSDGDRIYAVVLGSDINQDGRTNGLTAPNPAAQEAVLRGAYADARIDPRATSYVECHGTGTLLGDPIEARALGAVVGAGRPADRPCLIGSVKSNLGHLESAAGLAGLAKVALGLHHGVVPGTLHFRSGNPLINFAELGLRVADAEHEWPTPACDRLAGVSSFGFGGTNAHVVLGGAPVGARRAAGQAEPDADARPVVLPVSARHPESLVTAAYALADRLDELVKTDAADLPAVAAAVSARRTHHNWRYAVIGATAAGLAARLREVEPSLLAEVRSERRLVFAFPGQTGPAPAALLALADADPLVAATLRRCDEVVEEEAGWSVLEVLHRPDADHVLREHTELAQPVAVAMQLALVAAWQGLGIRPTEVIGHSLGEVPAAVVAGALSLAQAMRVAVARGRVVSTVIGTGRMLAMAVGQREADAIVARAGGRIAVATVNGPAAVVLSGGADALEELRVRAEAEGTLVRWVPVDYPSHSPWMAGPAIDLTAGLDGLEPAAPALAFWSSADGGALASPLNAAYWGHNLRSPVRFAAAADALLRGGPVIIVELGAHPVLRTPFAQLAAAAGRLDSAFVATMERGADPVWQLRAGLARLYELGIDPRWDRLATRSDYLPVPTYPWRRMRCWLPRPATQSGRLRGGHPLLGQRLDLASPGGPRGERWELTLTGEPPSVVAGHVVGGRAVLPGAGYLELALAAGRRLGIEGPIEVRDARFTAFLPLAEGPVSVQTIAADNGDNGFDVTVMSKHDGGDWLVNATATVAAAAGPIESAPVADPATARATCFHPITAAVFYGALGSAGLTYTAGFRLLDDIWSGADTAVAALGTPAEPARACVLDPRTLDSALQLTAAASRAVPETRSVMLGVRRLVVDTSAPADGDLSVVARIDGADDDGARTAAVAIFAGQRPVATIEGMRMTAVAAAPAGVPGRGPHLYELVWRRQDDSSAQARALDGSAWLVATSGAGVGDDVTARLREAGARVRTVDAGCQDWDRPFAEMRDSGRPAVDVVYIARTAADPDAREIAACVVRLAALIRAASAAEVEVRRLWVVTSGSQSVIDAPQPVRPGPAALWGLVRVLPFERPDMRGYCVDLDADPDAGSVTGLLAELRAPSAETEIALRGGRRYVARLVVAPAPDSRVGPEAVRPGAGYLISGGLGAIGLRVARWLSDQGAGRIGLLGRTLPGEDALRMIAELERAGTKMHVFTGDVADPHVAADAVAELRRLGPIRGVAHAAGVLDDGPLLSMSAAAIESVLRPKVGGALCLDAATEGDPLDWMIHFSSAASVLGSPGQANYCAANAFLDAYGAAQRSAGRPAVVVNWGAWADAGLAAGAAGAGGRLSAAYSALDPDEGIEALAAILRADRPRTVVLGADLRHLVRLFPGEVGTARFSELISADDVLLQSIGLGSQRSARPELRQSYTPPRNEVERRIAGIWQRSLGFDGVGVDDGFFELGGDSVFANQMVLEVNRALGVGITAATAFEHLTVARLAELAEQDMLERLCSISEEEAEHQLRHEDEG